MAAFNSNENIKVTVNATKLWVSSKRLPNQLKQRLTLTLTSQGKTSFLSVSNVKYMLTCCLLNNIHRWSCSGHTSQLWLVSLLKVVSYLPSRNVLFSVVQLSLMILVSSHQISPIFFWKLRMTYRVNQNLIWTSYYLSGFNHLGLLVGVYLSV